MSLLVVLVAAALAGFHYADAQQVIVTGGGGGFGTGCYSYCFYGQIYPIFPYSAFAQPRSTVVIVGGRKMLASVASSGSGGSAAPSPAANCLTVEEARCAFAPAASLAAARRPTTIGTSAGCGAGPPLLCRRSSRAGRRRRRCSFPRLFRSDHHCHSPCAPFLLQVFATLPDLYFLRNAVVNQKFSQALRARNATPFTFLAPSDSAVKCAGSRLSPPQLLRGWLRFIAREQVRPTTPSLSHRPTASPSAHQEADAGDRRRRAAAEVPLELDTRHHPPELPPCPRARRSHRGPPQRRAAAERAVRDRQQPGATAPGAWRRTVSGRPSAIVLLAPADLSYCLTFFCWRPPQTFKNQSTTKLQGRGSEGTVTQADIPTCTGASLFFSRLPRLFHVCSHEIPPCRPLPFACRIRAHRGYRPASRASISGVSRRGRAIAFDWWCWIWRRYLSGCLRSAGRAAFFLEHHRTQRRMGSLGSRPHPVKTARSSDLREHPLSFASLSDTDSFLRCCYSLIPPAQLLKLPLLQQRGGAKRSSTRKKESARRRPANPPTIGTPPCCIFAPRCCPASFLQTVVLAGASVSLFVHALLSAHRNGDHTMMRTTDDVHSPLSAQEHRRPKQMAAVWLPNKSLALRLLLYFAIACKSSQGFGFGPYFCAFRSDCAVPCYGTRRAQRGPAVKIQPPRPSPAAALTRAATMGCFALPWFADTTVPNLYPYS